VDAEGRTAVAADPGFFFGFKVGVEPVFFHSFEVGNGTVFVFVDVVLVEEFHLLAGEFLALEAEGEFGLFMLGAVFNYAACAGAAAGSRCTASCAAILFAKEL